MKREDQQTIRNIVKNTTRPALALGPGIFVNSIFRVSTRVFGRGTDSFPQHHPRHKKKEARALRSLFIARRHTYRYARVSIYIHTHTRARISIYHGVEREKERTKMAEERDPLLPTTTTTATKTRAANIREEKDAKESFRKKLRVSRAYREKFTKKKNNNDDKEENDDDAARANSSSSSAASSSSTSSSSSSSSYFHDVFAHGAVLTLVLFSAFFAFMCFGFVSRSHYVRARENALVKAMNGDFMLEERLMKSTNDLVPLSAFLKEEEEEEAEKKRKSDDDDRERVERKEKKKNSKRDARETKYSNGKSFARAILTKEEMKPFEKWLAKDGEIELDKLVEALRADKEALYRGWGENDDSSSSSSSSKWKHSSATFAALMEGGAADEQTRDSTVPNSKHKFSLCLDDMENWDVRLGAGAWMDALIQTKPEGKNSAGECFTNVVYDSGPECANADVRVFQSGSVLWKGAYVGKENPPSSPQEGASFGAVLMAKLGFFDNDILGPDVSQDIMVDSSPNSENRTVQDPIEITEEAIYEDQTAFWETKSNRRMLLDIGDKKSKKNTSSKKEQQQQQQQQQQQAALWRLPPKQNPDQVYVYASLETPGAFGKDLLNEGLLSQVDYIAHGNEKASSVWLPQMISTKGLMASYEAFMRSKQSRIPGIAWLGKNCPDNAPKMKVLKEVSNHFPVFSIGECRRNSNEPLGLPEHKVMGSGGIDYFTKTQLALSDYLFYYVGEDADCPGAIHADLWMALARGSIPVYFGTASVYEYLPCPEGDCIVDVKKFDSSAHLAKELRKISSSEKLYKKATEWRRQSPDKWPLGFKRGIARASQDFRKTLCDSVLKKGGDQAGSGVTKEDVIKRTITSVPWSNAAAAAVTPASAATQNGISDASSSSSNARLEGALRAEKAAESGDARASSVVCAKQTEVIALGQKVSDMLGFESETDGFTDPTDFIDVEIKSKQEFEKERKEQEAEEEEEFEEFSSAEDAAAADDANQ